MIQSRIQGFNLGFNDFFLITMIQSEIQMIQSRIQRFNLGFNDSILEFNLLSIFLHINSKPMHHAKHQNLNTPCYRVLTGGCTLFSLFIVW